MEATYRSVKDLAGKRIAIYDDPAAERWVQQNIPGARISKFSGDDGWFEAVEKDQADALIYDYPFAAEEIKAHPQTTIVQYNLNQSKYAVGIPAGNYDLVYEVNAAIDKFKATPQYAELMREYLTTSSEVFMKPVAGRKTYTVTGGRHAQPHRGQRAQGCQSLERDLGSQPGARREREPDLSKACTTDALTRAEGKGQRAKEGAEGKRAGKVGGERANVAADTSDLPPFHLSFALCPLPSALIRSGQVVHSRLSSVSRVVRW